MRLMLSKCNIIFLSLGALVFLLGLSCFAFTTSIYDYILTSALKMTNSETQAFKAWQKPKAPIMMDIYFFNWTNPEDIYNHSTKPILQEVGPYRYIQYKEKVNITWNHENGTITYKYLKHFYVDENSPRKDSDVINSLNMVALSAAHMANDWNFLLKPLIKMSLMSANIYVTKTVKELLFDGYRDPILETASAIPFLSDEKVDRFGWFHGRNGTVGTDGVYNMLYTPGPSFGTLKKWNYESRTPFYEGHCSDIYGSGGEMYPRNMQPTVINFFSPEMCRSVKFNFEKNVTVKGHLGYKYSPGPEVFDNGTEIRENECYCNGKCKASGVLNVSACRQDAPVFLSLPHFYYADKSYVEAVEGLNPSKDKHELFITLEPNTGIISDIQARMQINALLQPLDFSLYEEVPEIMFPILWFEQKVIMSDELASGLALLFSLPDTLRYVSIGVLAAGLVFIVALVLYIVLCKKKQFKSERKPTKEEIPLNEKVAIGWRCQ